MSNWRDDIILNIGSIQERSCPSLEVANLVLDDNRYPAYKFTLHRDCFASLKHFEAQAKNSTAFCSETTLYKPGGRAIAQHAVRDRKFTPFNEHVQKVFDESSSDILYNDNVAAVHLLRLGEHQ